MDMNAAAIFARVVEAKGFSAAARLLDMPKTTVSKKVGDLEADLGVRLLNRTTRRLSLTEAGARAHAHIVAAMRLMEQAERETRAVQHEPSGLLTIAAPGGIGVPFLMPLIAAFMARYPAVEIAHLSLDTPVDLGDERIDVMLWPGDPGTRAHAVPVTHVEIALYASTAYLARHGLPQQPRDLAGHAVIAFTQSIGRHFVWTLRQGDVVSEIDPAARIRFRSNDPGAILAAIEAGHGIGSLPVRFVQRMAAGHDVVRVLPDWQGPSIPLSALYRDGSATSLKARLFIDFVTDWFRNN